MHKVVCANTTAQGRGLRASFAYASLGGAEPRNYLCNMKHVTLNQHHVWLHPLTMRNYLCNPAIVDLWFPQIRLHPLTMRNYLCNGRRVQTRKPGLKSLH